MAKSLGRRTQDHQVAGGSNPVHRAANCNPGQVVYTCDSAAKQYNLVPANGRWCLAAVEVTADLEEINGSLPPGLWLRSPARQLLRTGISSGTLHSLRVWDYLYLIFTYIHSWGGQRGFSLCPTSTPIYTSTVSASPCFGQYQITQGPFVFQTTHVKFW